MLRPVTVTLEMIKFQHTVFALPFALLGAMTAASGIPAPSTLAWILLAMIGARSAAMAFNRLVDADIDGRNPRTAMRALPAGLVTRPFVAGFTAVSAAIFVFAASQLNPLALALSPVALAIVLGYSFAKRFTAASHLLLGLSLAIAPVGASIAVLGRFDPAVLVLGAAVLFWTAGFDILYSLQDLEFDRRSGLHSIPTLLGTGGAIVASRLLHLAAAACFAGFGVTAGLGPLYFTGAAAGAGLLIWQHSIVSADDISRINAAFFTANGILSMVMFVFGACDILIGG